jgi:hypothetical protein
LRDPAKSIVGKRRGVVVRVFDANQIAFRVVAVGGDVVRRVRHREQPVRIIVRVSGGFPVLVGDRSAPSAIVVTERRGVPPGYVIVVSRSPAS